MWQQRSNPKSAHFFTPIQKSRLSFHVIRHCLIWFLTETDI